MPTDQVKFCWNFGFWTAYFGLLGLSICLWGWLAFWVCIIALGVLLIAAGVVLERSKR